MPNPDFNFVDVGVGVGIRIALLSDQRLTRCLPHIAGSPICIIQSRLSAPSFLPNLEPEPTFTRDVGNQTFQTQVSSLTL